MTTQGHQFLPNNKHKEEKTPHVRGLDIFVRMLTLQYFRQGKHNKPSKNEDQGSHKRQHTGHSCDSPHDHTEGNNQQSDIHPFQQCILSTRCMLDLLLAKNMLMMNLKKKKSMKKLRCDKGTNRNAMYSGWNKRPFDEVWRRPLNLRGLHEFLSCWFWEKMVSAHIQKKGGTLNEETNGSTRKQHLEGVSGRTFVTTKEMKLYFMTSKDDKDSFLSSFSAE